MSDKSRLIQLRFNGKRPNTRTAKEYMEKLDAVGYGNRTEFVEDAIVFYYLTLKDKSNTERLCLKKAFSAEEVNHAETAPKEEEKPNSDYEDALRYFEEKRRIQ